MELRSFLNKIYDVLYRILPSNSLRVRCLRAKGVKVGRNVYIGCDVIIDHFYPQLIEIQDHARIGHGVIILAHNRPGDYWMNSLGEQCAPVKVERHAAIYAGAIVMPGVTVGECAIVREGATVEENVPPFTVVAGVPSRVIEELPRESLHLRTG